MAGGAAAVDRVVGDAAWHPLRLSPDFSALTFVRLSRADLDAVLFLEERFIPDTAERVEFSLEAVDSALPAVISGPPRYIFHSSMAASTLLARLFDLPGQSMSLTEPIVLNQLSATRSRGQDVRGPLETIVRLLSRPFGECELVVVKPGNSANNLMPLFGHCFGDLQAVTIEAPIRDFLRSVAKRGSNGRIMYRRLFAFVSRTKALATGMSPEDLWELTDLQVAGMAWLLQHGEFIDMLRLRPDQFRSLESGDVVDPMSATLSALGEHFGVLLSVDPAHYDAVFNRHSKDRSRPFDAAERRRELDSVDDSHGEEIDTAARLVETMAERCGLPMTLPNSLLGG